MSAAAIQVIKPSLFPKEIIAFFTQKNTVFSQQNAQIPGLNLGFNTPDSRETVQKNRQLVFSEFGIDIKKTVFCNQVHGTSVVEVSEPGLIPETDGMLTSIAGLGLCILVADCAAVLLYDSESGYIAALHAGWRGAVGGIIPKTLSELKAKGSSLKEVKAFISPCISRAKFEVGEEVAEQFPAEFVLRAGFEKPHVDLKAYLFSQVSSFGIPDHHIELDLGCTVTDDERFFSYRREGKQSGRLLAYIQKR